MSTTNPTARYRDLPGLVGQIGAACVRHRDIEDGVPFDELNGRRGGLIRCLLGDAGQAIAAASRLMGTDAPAEEIAGRVQEAHDKMDAALDIFLASDCGRLGWAFAERAAFIPAH